MTYAFKFVSSPVGLLKLVANDLALVAILWENDDPKRVRLGSLVEDVDHPILCLAEQQLGEYFAGRRKSFDLPLDFVGTPFQKEVCPSCSTFRLDRHEPTARSLIQSASIAPSERLARQTERIRSPLWRRAIA